MGMGGANDIEERMEIERAAELANLYKVLAVVHTVYGEEMRREREWEEGLRIERLERRGSARMGSKIGSVKGRRMVRRVGSGASRGSGTGNGGGGN